MYPLQFRISQYVALALVQTMLFVACKSPKTQGLEDAVHKTAVDKLGSDIDTFPNSSGNCILYIQKTSTSQTNSLKLLVLRVSDQATLHEQSFVPGYAKWITDSTIEVLSVPGMIRENESLDKYKKIISIETHKP